MSIWTILTKSFEHRRQRFIGRFPGIALGTHNEPDADCGMIVPVTAAPSGTLLEFPSSTLYVNRNGDVNTSLYVNINGTAVPLPLSGGAVSAGDLTATTPTELTIASGVITVTQLAHTVDTESDAASDDLVTINGGSGEQLLLLRPASGARTVVLKHGSGNIECPGGTDISLAEASDSVLLWWNGTSWAVVGVKANAQAGTFTTTIVDGLPAIGGHSTTVQYDSGVVSLATGGAATTLTMDIPAGALVKGAALKVTTTVANVDSTTGTLTLSGGSTATLGTISAFTSGTKGTFAAAAPTTATTQAVFTLSGGADNTPSAGAVRLVLTCDVQAPLD